MTAHAITVRLAGQRDAQAIALMSRDLVESGLGWKYDAARVLKAIRDPNTLTPVACEGGRIAGFGIMEFGDERAHLVLLAVRPSHRRMGIGRRLVDWLVESARTAGIASLHLELRAGNEAARGFYRAVGFDETIVVPGYYRGREAALRMICVLRAAGPVPYTWRPSTT
jgi:ribosomal-protein-alanine N-acetyltransferase